MLQTFFVHNQHYQVDPFCADLQPPASTAHGNERGSAPAVCCAATGHATPMFAANDEAALELNLKKAGLWVTEVALERPLTVRTAAKASSGQHAKISGKKGRRELIDRDEREAEFAGDSAGADRCGMPSENRRE